MGKFILQLISIAALSGPSMACSTSGNTDGTGAGDGAVNTYVFLDAGPDTPVSPDGGSSCGVDCNYQTQQGCDAGLMCHPVLNADVTAVSPQCLNAGSKTAGESCTWLGCQPGYICAIDGHCHHMCCGGDWSVCAANESCTAALSINDADAGKTVSAVVSVCELVSSCNVLDPSSCGPGKSCYIVDSRAGVQCLKTGTVPFGQACTSTQLCAAGFTCIQGKNNSGSNCRRLCRAVVGGGNPGCPLAEGVCAHFVRDPQGAGECTPTNQ